ncbi:MAG: hypothetical protein QM531_02570, partial [Candidatus Pacebacteria bacterium]|nr:hypothetical protein [Candidatus Paceibacterota bacterium]
THGGSNPLERNEVSERVPSAGGDQRLGRGWVLGGPNPLEPRQVGTGPDKSRDRPRQVGVNAAKQARESLPPEAINDWAGGGS